MPTEAEVRAAFDALSNVGRLVHLAWRFDEVSEQEMAATIFSRMRYDYEAELTRSAQAVGCNSRRGLLQSGPSMSALRDMANEHAASIVRTYNRDLARAIVAIRDEIPSANRHTYSARLRQWENARAQWKEPQIGLMGHQFGTQQAREDFLRFNDVIGRAVFGPSPAAEEECQGLLAGNPWPLSKVNEMPTPIHINCPHRWNIEHGKLASGDCQNLWVGG